jgi:pimeloyl-ACP methyl ester carboxylesterase
MARNRTVPAIDGFVGVNDVRLHYRECGPSDEATVVVLHGVMGHCREWDVLTSELAQHFRVLAVDQRGHGRSAWASSYSGASFAVDLIALVEQIGRPPVHLVGHSLGGIAAMLAAATRPDLFDRVVLIDIGPTVVSTDQAADLSDHIRALGSMSYPDKTSATVAWLDANPLAQPELVANYVSHCLVPRSDGRLVWRFDAAHLAQSPTGGVAEEDLWHAAEDMVAPTLLIRGERSPFLSQSGADSMVRRMRTARLETIRGGGHDLGVEQPYAVTTAAIEFLRN